MKTLSAQNQTAAAVAQRPNLAMLWDRLQDRVPYLDEVGDVLYLVGFWLEYGLLCACRAVVRVAGAVFGYAGRLLGIMLRPLVQGVSGLLQDLARPFVVLYLGARQFGALSAQGANPQAVRRQFGKLVARTLGVVLRGILALVLPAAALAALLLVVRHGIGRQFVLDVQLGGQSVGYVQSEQVFNSARADVQERLNNARAAVAATGADPSELTWDFEPTYTLTIGEATMGEGEMANALMRMTSSEITEATAVYVDDELRYVTTEGDHLRSYLENYKAPQNGALAAGDAVSYVHDIRMVDGIYMNSSLVPYQDIVSAFSAGAEVFTYTAAEGETVQSAVDNTGVSFDSLAMMNPDLLSLDQEIPEGTVLLTGAASPELLKLQVVHRQTREEEIPYNTENSESDEYDFGEVVVIQEGEPGLQQVTEDITYIDDIAVSTNVVEVNVTKEPVTRVTVTGTHLKSGMIASIGTGSFVWPVPQYKYVSRWMSSGHRGADICANYGTPIIASDGGAVIEAGWHYSWGNYVKIDHGNGWATLYGHMSSIAVSRGQAVSQGQVIGYVGSTGYSFGNHCHFEMYRNGALYSAANLFAGSV